MYYVRTFLLRHFYFVNGSFLLVPTFSLIAGIWWYWAGCFVIPVLLLIFFSLFVLFIFKQINIFILSIIFFAIGALLIHRQYQSFDNFYAKYNNSSCNIEGIIIDISPLYNTRYNFCTTIQVNRIKRQDSYKLSNNWQSLKQNIEIYSFKPPSAEVIDNVKIDNISIKKPSNKSFTGYLMRNGVYATYFASHFDCIILDHPKHSIQRWIYFIRSKLNQQIKQKLSGQTYTLFAAIFLGYKRLNKKYVDSTKENFKVWGISHHLARSGLHLVVLLILIELFFRIIPIYYTYKHLLSLLFIIMYHLLSWPSISFIRALLTFIFYKLCIFLSVTINTLHLIVLVCLLTLLYNPLHLFFLDFQLSFGLTFAIAWLNHIKSIVKTI